MDILVINHYAGSPRHGMEYRPFYMGREWTRLGHRVTVAAASCSHVRTSRAAVGGAVTEEDIEGVRYLWFKTPQYSGNGRGRALNIFAFVSQLFRHVDRLAAACLKGSVIASSTYPLDIFPAAAIAQAAGARLAFEVHDLWPLSPIELGGMSRYHPFIMLMQRAENFAYRHARKVISIIPKAAPHMQRHGLAPHKFIHIPNGVEVAEWLTDRGGLPAQHQEALEELRKAGKFVVLYAGGHGLANALHCVIRAAALLRETPARFVLVGQGPEKEALQRLASSLNLTNLTFLPPVQKSVVPALLAEADALVISWRRSALYRFGISPNKLVDYMMSGKPVIQAVDAGNDLVAESRCGISVPPEAPEMIAFAVRQLMEATTAERAAMGARGHDYVQKRHDYRVLARSFAEALQSN